MIGIQRVVCPSPQSKGAIKIRLAGPGVKEVYFYKNNFPEKDMLKTISRYWVIATIAGVMLLAQSCSTSKKCGCGSDLNRVYRSPRR
jgi:hypothetical protein